MIINMIMLKAKLIRQEWNLLADKEQMISKEEAMTLAAAIAEVMAGHVKDRKTKAAITEEHLLFPRR